MSLSHDSIRSWLDEIASPQLLDDPFASSSRKRKRDPPEHRSQRASSTDGDEKRHTMQAGAGSSVEVQEADEAENPNVTPLQPARFAWSPTMLSRGAPGPATRASTDPSLSPSHVMAKLRLAMRQTLKVLNDSEEITEEHALHSVRGLLQRLNMCRHGINVLPEAFKKTPLDDAACGEAFKLVRPDFFGDTGCQEPRCLDRLKDISETSRSLTEDRSGHRDWNDQVQYPILAAAEGSPIPKSQLDLAFFSDARIEPDDLLPVNVSPCMLERRLVDDAVILKPSAVLQAAYENLKPFQKGQRSFNHTCKRPERPIALSITTTGPDESISNSEALLAVWLAAQFKRLRLLVEEAGYLQARSGTLKESDEESVHLQPRTTMPVLPAVIFQGTTCHVYFAAHSPDSIRPDKIIMWRCMDLHADTLPGICQVIKAAQILMTWAQETYRPWFERNAAPLSPEQRASLLS